MTKRLTFLLLGLVMSFSLFAQKMDSKLETLKKHNIQLDVTDESWLSDNSSFLIDMASMAKMDTTAMNRAIIQMSTKLLSNNLTEITDEEARSKKELITDIIYGAFDNHGLESEKRLSAMSWYNMIVKEIGI